VTRTELVLTSKQLSMRDLAFLSDLGRIEGENIILERSLKGYTLKSSVSVPLGQVLAQPIGVVKYVFSLISERPRLIPLVFQNESLLKLASYFLRYKSGSQQSLYAYTETLSRYSAWAEQTPDQLAAHAKESNGLNPSRVNRNTEMLERYIAFLQDQGLTPGRVYSCAKHVKTFYKVNDVDVKLPYSLSRRVVCNYRAPRSEELQQLMAVADLRERVIIAMTSLGGFREGTLVKLRYGHVSSDLEKGITPIHIHVESEITKGKYSDFDTFVGGEAVQALQEYMHARRKGLLDRRIPHEEITDESPLVRDQSFHKAKPITEKQVRKIVHRLYAKVGLIRKAKHGRYDLSVHSLRKFFRTQMTALGVQSDYVEFMMGHSISRYDDVESKGVEFLRNVYRTAGLTIAPRKKGWELEALKAFARGIGLDPEKVLTEAAFAEPHRAYATPEDFEAAHTRTLSLAIKDLIKKEIVAKPGQFAPATQ